MRFARRIMSSSNLAGEKPSSVLLERTLLSLSAATTAVLFTLPLYYSSYGLYLGAEGFWLNSIANPFIYAINSPPSLFGFVYHWPYQWLGGNIAALRVANVMLTILLGWSLSFLVIRRFWTAGWSQALVPSAGIASLSLVLFTTGC